MPSAPGAAGPGAPFPQWAVNSSTGNVAEVVNAAEKALAETTAFPEKEIFFTSAAAADAYSKSIGGIGGQDPASKALNPALNTGAKAATSAWSAATAIPRFLSMLTSGNLWLRVGEVAAGLILLGIGVNALFKGKPMSAVTGAAGKLAPLAMA